MTKAQKTKALYRRAGSALSLFVLLVAAACSTSFEQNGFGFENDSLLISEEREHALGAQEHPKILAAFGGAYQNAKLQSGLESVVARLSRVSPRPDIEYTITVLNTPAVNAFALPGGFLYVTRGLLSLANDEDEIAAVLSHEMGHVSSRHAVKRESQSSTAAVIGQAMKDLVRGSGGTRNAMLDGRARVAKFSRQQEFEADQIGLETAVQAGFDPFGAATFLTSMQRNNDYRNRLLIGGNARSLERDFSATHPSTPDRISQVIQLSKSFGFDPGDRARKRESYLHLIDGMMFGNDPSEGFIRDRRFIHPDLRFEYEVTPGFTIQNTSDAVFALGPKGSALRFDGVDVPENQALTQYVARSWARGIDVKNVRADIIGSMPVVFGTASHGGWDYRLAAVRFDGRRVFRFLMAARDIDAKLDRDFETSVRSLRALSLEEAHAAQPLRIEIASADRGDTTRSLAARMAVEERAWEQFLLLNGFDTNTVLQPGQQVKLIVD